MAVQGPGFGPVAAAIAPLQGGQVSDLTVYQATLPAGTIQAGDFAVAASGGSDVGAFQSSVQIGAGVQFPTSPAGTVFTCNQPVTISWTGGDPKAWVTVSKVFHEGTYDAYDSTAPARVSAGSITIPSPNEKPPCDPSLPIDLLIEVDPDPSEVTAVSAAGLSLGGQHTWTYLFPAFSQ